MTEKGYEGQNLNTGYAGIAIIPIRIELFNESDFPGSIPLFQSLLAMALVLSDAQPRDGQGRWSRRCNACSDAADEDINVVTAYPHQPPLEYRVARSSRAMTAVAVAPLLAPSSSRPALRGVETSEARS
jgi:hypothetical protein